MAHILVADDDKAFREALTETLVDLGHTVQGAASGEETLAHVQDGRVDLLFLDLRMPDMDGLEVLRRLRTQTSHASLPVIILTAYAGSRNTIEAMKLGAFDHLTKPVGRRDISEVLDHALAHPQSQTFANHTGDIADDGLIGASRPMPGRDGRGS